MASITERKGRFLVRVRRDGHKPVFKTFTTRKDAAAWARRVEADMESGRWQDEAAEVPTLAAAVKLYRAGPAKRLKGADTYSFWFNELEASDIGKKRVSDITPFDLSAWRDSLEVAGLKPGTVVRKLGLLSGLLTWCQKERGWLVSNPMRSVSKPRVNDSRSRTYSEIEVAYLQSAARTSKATWLPAAITLLMNSAMRRGEVFGLRREDIDFAASVAFLADTKNGLSRQVPLCPKSLAALRMLFDAAPDKPEALLLPLGAPGAISLAFRRTVARARRSYENDCAANDVQAGPDVLKDCRLHDLRHQAITQWATTGMAVTELAAVSGHKTLGMLGRYVNLSASALAAKMARVTA